MDLAEQVDPEVFHQVMERFAALLAEGVHRFEGTVTQFTGDGVMALCRAPIAHEDHAQRACYAALHRQEALRRYANELRLSRALNFAARMGLNSGEVVVGTIGDDLRMDYTAQGHVVGLAARMEQIAEPGKVYVAEHTARLVTGFFRLADLGPLTVKGAQDPGPRGARCGAREDGPVPPGVRVPARVLRDRRAGHRAGDAREDRRQAPAARPRPGRRPAAPPRLPGRPGSRAPPAAPRPR